MSLYFHFEDASGLRSMLWLPPRFVVETQSVVYEFSLLELIIIAVVVNVLLVMLFIDVVDVHSILK